MRFRIGHRVAGRLAAACVTACCLGGLAGNPARAAEGAPVALRSLNPDEILTTLDLERPELAGVKAAAEEGDALKALGALRAHYRARFPLAEPSGKINEANRRVADDVANRIFQWGPYESAQYGEDMRWDWDPRGDIEWVAAMYRFHWAEPLEQAYRETRDETYVKAYVDLTRDWIARHPLEEHEKTHYVYERWRGFAWLDIQTGIRATRLCRSFPVMVHGETFTPEFLGVFLASLYDHQVKTEQLPMNAVHNKAVFEQRGFVNIAYTFPEFKESRRWMELAMDRLSGNLVAQVTPDGVQREWSGGYHSGVLRDALEIMERMETSGIEVRETYRDRVRGMFEYIYGIATPDLGYPMFGDTARTIDLPPDRAQWPLYGTLMQGAEVFGDPKYAARATLNLEHLPPQASCAFRDAGMYALRNAWGPEQIYLALHCSPPAISGHDQPDNGTFELYAFGRWLMTDSGYYTYGHDPEGRNWHRQTRVHQTLTLDGKNATVDGKPLLWHAAPDLTAVAVENASYDGLVHRRTVWFVQGRFFVVLDEAIGNAPGALDLHFQFAPGDIEVHGAEHCARTSFEDVNVLVWQGPDAPVNVVEEDGWYAWSYGHRAPRKAVRFRHHAQAPAAYLTLLVPWQGTETPAVTAALPEGFEIGAGRVELTVQAFGEACTLGRDLNEQRAWCARPDK